MPIILGILINLLEIWIIFPIAIAFYIIVLIITPILKMQQKENNAPENVTKYAENVT